LTFALQKLLGRRLGFVDDVITSTRGRSRREGMASTPFYDRVDHDLLQLDAVTAQTREISPAISLQGYVIPNQPSMQENRDLWAFWKELSISQHESEAKARHSISS
jgi:hypothetical protein